MLFRSVATWNMLNVRREADVLATEYVPEVKIASAIESSVLLMMYDIRGYGMTAEDRYLVGGRKSLEELKQHLAEGRKLIAAATGLVKFGESIGQMEREVRAYEDLINQTVERQAAVVAERGRLDAAAAAFISGAGAFVSSQEQQLAAELEASAETKTVVERVEKIKIANNVIDSGNAARINWQQFVARNDARYIDDMKSNLDALTPMFAKLHSLTRQQADIDAIKDRKSVV